jgi:cell division protein FtsB
MTTAVAPSRRRPGTSGAAGRYRTLAVALLATVVLVVLGLSARAYVSQRADIARTADQLRELTRANAHLTQRRDRLTDRAAVQRTARREFGLVAVGEESYSVLPPATAGLVLPNAWPFDRVAGPLARAAARR